VLIASDTDGKPPDVIVYAGHATAKIKRAARAATEARNPQRPPAHASPSFWCTAAESRQIQMERY
jgi:hypothetical protein